MLTDAQKTFLQTHNISELSNVEAVVLQVLTAAVDNSHVLEIDTIYNIANTRYYKSDYDSYYSAMQCLKHFGLIKPFVNKADTNPDDDYYQITDSGRQALAAVLS